MLFYIFFFFNDTATTEIYTLSLHDALPILSLQSVYTWLRKKSMKAALSTSVATRQFGSGGCRDWRRSAIVTPRRSEEHTSELQSRQYLVCRLLLEKKKKQPYDLILLVSSTT